jgi:phage tail-like protein
MPIHTEFPQAAYRYDPYRSYKFRVKWDGRYVAGVSKVNALTRMTQVVTYRAGTDSFPARRMPGQSEYEAITLERGVTHDIEFEQWANKVWDYHNSAAEDQQGGAGGQAVSLNDFRRDIVLELNNGAGQKVMAYNIYRCWPSAFRALPDLDGKGDAVAIESLRLENEGWERDLSIEEPPDPSFTLPAE